MLREIFYEFTKGKDGAIPALTAAATVLTVIWQKQPVGIDIKEKSAHIATGKRAWDFNKRLRFHKNQLLSLWIIAERGG